MSPFMTTAEVAEFLRLIDRQGRPDLERARWFINHKIPPDRVRLIGRSLRVHRDDVEALMQPRRRSA